MSGNSAARLSRLLALVPWLYAHDGVTIDEAAQHFAVSSEQLEKDLWLLILCGLPGYGPDQLIDIQFWGSDARIHVIDPQTLERPVRLSGDESSALLIALRLLAQVPGGHDRQALVSAMEKLQQAAGGDPVEELVVVEAGTQTSVVQAVDRALDANVVLRVRYAGSARDAITDREVEPIAVRTVNGRAYLEAWCRLAGAIRTFRVDRIQAAEVTREPCADGRQSDQVGSAAGEPAAGPTSTAPIWAPITAELLVKAPARWALDVHPMQVVGDGPEGGVIARIAVQDPRWLVRMVLSLRGLVVVRSPENLRNAVMHAAEAALGGYDEPSSPEPEGT